MKDAIQLATALIYFHLLSAMISRQFFHTAWQEEDHSVSDCLYSVWTFPISPIPIAILQFHFYYAKQYMFYISYFFLCIWLLYEINHILKMEIFCDITPRRLKNTYRRFERSNVFEMSVTIYQATRRNITEGLNIHQHCSEDLQPRIASIFSVYDPR
jgi:hypothetical protein